MPRTRKSAATPAPRKSAAKPKKNQKKILPCVIAQINPFLVEPVVGPATGIAKRLHHKLVYQTTLTAYTGGTVGFQLRGLGSNQLSICSAAATAGTVDTWTDVDLSASALSTFFEQYRLVAAGLRVKYIGAGGSSGAGILHICRSTNDLAAATDKAVNTVAEVRSYTEMRALAWHELLDTTIVLPITDLTFAMEEMEGDGHGWGMITGIGTGFTTGAIQLEVAMHYDGTPTADYRSYGVEPPRDQNLALKMVQANQRSFYRRPPPRGRTLM